MSYQLKRLDLARSSSPLLVGLAVAGLALSLVGVKMKSLPIMGVGVVLYSLGVVAIAKPVMTTLLGILGAGGGIITFFLMPSDDFVSATISQRILAWGIFVVLYIDLMNTLLLLGAFMYNTLVQAVGMNGIRLEISEEAVEEAAEAS